MIWLQTIAAALVVRFQQSLKNLDKISRVILCPQKTFLSLATVEDCLGVVLVKSWTVLKFLGLISSFAILVEGKSAIRGSLSSRSSPPHFFDHSRVNIQCNFCYCRFEEI